MKKKKICVFLGKRGGFGALIRTMKLIEKEPSLELRLIVSDMHLSKKFGFTVTEVKKWFKKIEKIDMKQKDDSTAERTKALGRCLMGVTDILKRIKPDVLLVIGDRGEVFVTVFAALNLNIPVAHIQGGDVSGNIDEIFRHAITKMSHIHFPATKDSAQRIKKMGEKAKNIFVVGDVHLDLIEAKLYSKADKVRKKFKIKKGEDFFLVLYHPETIGARNNYKNMKEVLKGVKPFRTKSILVYPCSDQGYQGVINAIKEFSNLCWFKVFKNIEAPDFLGLMSQAKVMIGNSSSGLIETPLFKLPVVNVGERQSRRLRNKNVIDVKAKEKDVKRAIKKALYDKKFLREVKKCRNFYGQGKTAEKIVKVLKRTKIDKELLNKRISY